jgi:hypothetical protein
MRPELPLQWKESARKFDKVIASGWIPVFLTNCLDKNCDLKGLKNLCHYEWLVFGSLKSRDWTSISIRNLELLAGLAEDRVVSVRREVAQNKSTPGVVLSRLHEDADVAVRVLVSRNRNHRSHWRDSSHERPVPGPPLCSIQVGTGVVWNKVQSN